MKKNTMMRVASALLVAVLLTTCAISGTFAKYVTAGTGSDSARVAKWGVKIASDYDAFKNWYTTHDVNYSSLYTNSVVTSNGDDVLAPGTSGVLSKINVTGKPEVAVEIKYDASVDLTNWNIGGVEYYCPVVITVDYEKAGVVNKAEIYGLDYSSESDFEAAIATAIEDATNSYAANTNLATETSGDLTVAWAWAFENGDTVGSVVCDENDDVKDTALGDKAAEDNAVKIAVAITTTVTQID